MNKITGQHTVNEAIQINFTKGAKEFLLDALNRINTRQVVTLLGCDYDYGAVELAQRFDVEIIPPPWIRELIEQIEAL